MKLVQPANDLATGRVVARWVLEVVLARLVARGEELEVVAERVGDDHPHHAADGALEGRRAPALDRGAPEGEQLCLPQRRRGALRCVEETAALQLGLVPE